MTQIEGQRIDNDFFHHFEEIKSRWKVKVTQIKNELKIFFYSCNHFTIEGRGEWIKNERSMKERKLDKTRSRSSSASKNDDGHHRIQIVYQ